jgi:1-acyl-sn-glycerol-3-phosphate acyltransferase
MMWWLDRLLVRLLFRIRVTGLEHWPEAPFQLVANHHNGFDPLLVIAVSPLTPRITWFGPREADFSRGFKNRVMVFFGGVIPYNPSRTTLTSAVRAVRGVFAGGGVVGIFAEGRAGMRETDLLALEEGAAAFAAASRVPILPCAIVGSSRLWLRKPIEIRFGVPLPPLPMPPGSDRAGRTALDRRLADALRALLPADEAPVPRWRPLEALLTDLLNGTEEREAHRRIG